MPARHAAGVVVGDVILVLLQGRDHVLAHDRHVVDVPEDFEAVRADLLAQLDAPRGLVEHVVLVVDRAVQPLHHDRDLLLFGQADDLLERLRARFHALLVGDGDALEGAVAGHADDVRHPVGGAEVEVVEAQDLDLVGEPARDALADGHLLGAGLHLAGKDERARAHHVVGAVVAAVHAREAGASGVGARQA